MYNEIRNDLIDALADYFDISTDTTSYDWVSGCYINGNWLSLANVVKALDSFIDDIASNLDD